MSHNQACVVPCGWRHRLIHRRARAVTTVVPTSTWIAAGTVSPSRYCRPTNARSTLRSITWDQGTEMAKRLEISQQLGVPVYFCDPHSPWQLGSNENTNGPLRDYPPKHTDLSIYAAKHLTAVKNELNHRPRHVLGDRSPTELFNTLPYSNNPTMLQR